MTPLTPSSLPCYRDSVGLVTPRAGQTLCYRLILALFLYLNDSPDGRLSSLQIWDVCFFCEWFYCWLFCMFFASAICFQWPDFSALYWDDLIYTRRRKDGMLLPAVVLGAHLQGFCFPQIFFLQLNPACRGI